MPAQVGKNFLLNLVTQLRLLFYLLFLLMGLWPALALSQVEPQDEAEAENVPQIVIGVGEVERVPLDGISPFVADADILGLEELPPGQEVQIVGLRGGATRVYYWKNSVLTYFAVEVVVSPIFSTGSRFSPVLKTNLPYFLYSFQNSSTYTKDSFFDSPTYGHSIYGLFPSKSGNLSLYSSFNQQAGGIYSLPTAALVYQNRGFQMNLGQAQAPIAQLVNVFGGADIFGSAFSFKFGDKTTHSLGLFGGFKRPTNLLDPIVVEEQVYGMSYNIRSSRPGTLTPDFLNIGLFGYQPQAGSGFAAAFNAGGIVEGNYHILRSLSLGGGYARTLDNKSAMSFRPTLELASGLIQGTYDFVQHGIEDLGASPQENDIHRSTLSASHAFKDKHTILRSTLFHNLSLTNAASVTPTSQAMGGAFGLARYFSFRKLYGFDYSVALVKSAGTDTLVNSWAANWVHPVGKTAFLSHQAGYFRSDLGSSLFGTSASSSFGVELDNMRYQADLSVAFSGGDSSAKTASLGQKITLGFSGGDVGLVMLYQNSDLGRNEHALQISPALNYQLTRNQLLGLGGGLSMSFTDTTQLSGSLSLQYQRFLGPAVTPDPLVKRLLGHGNSSSVSGTVFLDSNYNTTLQKTDTPLAGVKLSLDDHLYTTTDVNGYYEFKNVRAGEHKLTLDPKTLALAEKPQVVAKQTFTVSGIQAVRLPVPITFKRAALRVQFLIDSNNNKQEDSDDEVIPIKKVFVILPSGEKREHTLRDQEGGALIGGMEIGKNSVGIDPLEVPDGVESLGPVQKQVTIAAYDEYPVTFLFRAVRALRGRLILMGSDKPLPPGLVLQMGAYSAKVDREGYYWFKDLAPGEYQINLKNLAKAFCVVDTTLRVVVNKGVFTQTRDIHLSNQCQ